MSLDDYVRRSTSLLEGNGRVKKGACGRVVAESAWWLDHPTGPIRSKGDGSQLVEGALGWQITYGANALCVERAIKLVLENMSFAMNHKLDNDGREFNPTLLFEALSPYRLGISQALNGSVMNAHDELFYYPSTMHHGKEFLKLGTHGISIDTFFDFLFTWLNIKQLQVLLVARHLR